MAIYLGNTPIAENVTIQQGGGVTIDDTLSDTSKNPVQNKVINAALNSKANLSDIPTELPANGGNADTLDGKDSSDFYPAKKLCVDGVDYNTFTDNGIYEGLGNSTSPTTNTPDGNHTNNNFYVCVIRRASTYLTQIAISVRLDKSVYIRSLNNGTWSGWVKANDGGNAATVNSHTVDANVPSNAVFTDTVYTHPSYTARTGVPTANQTPAFGGTFTVSQPVSDAKGHITAINSRTITVPSTVASTSANGLMTTGAQTLAGNKTFNGQVIPAGASDTTVAQARKIYAGTSDMTAGTTKLETGAIYLVYE